MFDVFVFGVERIMEHGGLHFRELAFNTIEP